MSIETERPSQEVTGIPESEKGTDVGIGKDTDVEIPVYAPDTEEKGTVESVPLAEQWKQEKQAVSLLDPIYNVIDHAQIFWKSRSLKAADAKLQRLQSKLGGIEKTYEGVEKAMDTSANIAPIMDTISKGVSGEGPSAAVADARASDQERAKQKLASMEPSISRLDEKIYKVEQKKVALERVKQEALDRIKGRYEAKAHAEQATVSAYEMELNGVSGNITTYQKRYSELQIYKDMALEETNGKEMLPADKANVLRLLDTISYEQDRIVKAKEKLAAVVDALLIKKDAAIKRRDGWQARIAPSKAKPESVQSSETAEAPQAQEVSPVVENTKSESEGDDFEPSVFMPQPAKKRENTEAPTEVILPSVDELVKQRSSSSEENLPQLDELVQIKQDGSGEQAKRIDQQEAPPNTLAGAMLKLRDAYEAASPEEIDYFTNTVSDARTSYEAKRPESNVFKWFQYLLELLAESKPEKKAPKK